MAGFPSRAHKVEIQVLGDCVLISGSTREIHASRLPQVFESMQYFPTLNLVLNFYKILLTTISVGFFILKKTEIPRRRKSITRSYFPARKMPP